jgi:hypothetical protein
MSDILAVIDEINASHRKRDLLSLTDAALLAYRDRIEQAIIDTPEDERPIMALFDEHELAATLAEMKRRHLAPSQPTKHTKTVRTAMERHSGIL